MKVKLYAKKHQYYLYVSILLIVLFFISNKFISNKITSVTQRSVNNSINRDVNAENIILEKELKNLYHFVSYAKNIIEHPTNQTSENSLFNELSSNCKYVISNNVIDRSYVLIIDNEKVVKHHFFGKHSNSIDSVIINQIIRLDNTKRNNSLDIVLKNNNAIYNRKIITHKLSEERTICIGYDINLLKYRDYFSKKYTGIDSYSILVNEQGICLLHPDKKYIGNTFNSLFETVSIEEVLTQNYNQHKYFDADSRELKIKAKSEYLDLEVFRYYNAIKISDSTVISVLNFPADIVFEEALSEVSRHFKIISILALSTFLLVLSLSRLQLRKEFYKNLMYEKEKKRLAISNEQYQQKNAILQLNQLRKKMNPHFLFNSLNSLVSLIDINEMLAKKFTLKLAEVYRYLLENRESNLATVKEEVDFLNQYFFLHEIRFKDCLFLNIEYNCKQKPLSKKIPFLSLETLTENAIKHNEITKQNPLEIKVVIKDSQIIISNTYNPRKTKEKDTHHIGLNYLKNCYEFHNTYSFKTEIIENKFKCYLPLLPKI